MNGLYEVLKELCDMVGKKLMEAKEKARAAGSLSTADIEYLDRLTHCMKSIKATMAMIDAEEGGAYADGGSSRWGRSERSYGDGSYDDGGSSARGRGRSARRDSMGRYASQMSNHGGFEEGLQELMEEAPNDQIRMELHRLMQKM